MAQANRASNGGRQKNNLAHEAKRQARFKAKREAGKAYEYKPNPYNKGSEEWYEEERKRAEKRNVDLRTPLARMTSIMAKLENALKKERLEAKNGKPKKERKSED